MGIVLLAGVLSTLEQAEYVARRNHVSWVEGWNLLHPSLTIVTMPQGVFPQE